MVWIKHTSGWLRDFIKYTRDSQLQLLAYSMSFATTLSIVPLITVSLFVFQKLGGIDESLSKARPLVVSYLAEGVGGEVVAHLEKMAERLQNGTISAIGAVLLIIASLKLLDDMEKAVHKIWRTRRRRPFWMRVTYLTLIIFLGPLSIAFLVGFLSWKTLMISSFFPDRGVIFVLIWLGNYLFIRFLPTTPVHHRPALISSFATTLCLVLLQLFYLKVTKSIFMYDKIYGSLATLPVFLMWIYLNWTVYLFGHALCSALQKDDTTHQLS